MATEILANDSLLAARRARIDRGSQQRLRDHDLDQSGCDVVDETGHDHVAGHFLARAQRVDVERDRRSRVVDRSLVQPIRRDPEEGWPAARVTWRGIASVSIVEGVTRPPTLRMSCFSGLRPEHVHRIDAGIHAADDLGAIAGIADDLSG